MVNAPFVSCSNWLNHRESGVCIVDSLSFFLLPKSMFFLVISHFLTGFLPLDFVHHHVFLGGIWLL